MIHREYTKIVLIDVIGNKPAEGKFQNTIELQYSIDPRFRPGHSPLIDTVKEREVIVLPTTINPTQTPKLIGAGIALSPYNRNEKYSANEARTRFLWLEFDNKLRDNNDTLFCRVLAYSPDQLISNNHPSLMDLPNEAPLSLNPEYIRVVTPESAHGHSGLTAMQKIEKSIDTQALLPATITLPFCQNYSKPGIFITSKFCHYMAKLLKTKKWRCFPEK